MKLEEKKISGETIYQGRVVRLEKDQVLCPNGQISFREVVRHQGGACILGITKENKILLIEQYRYAYDEVLYELPAGKLEPNEDPKVAAIREFEEETGFKPNQMEFLGIDYPTCGYSSEKIYLYYTKDFIKTNSRFDDDEMILLHEMDFSTVLKLIRDGKIKDGKTINTIFLFLLKEGNFQ